MKKQEKTSAKIQSHPEFNAVVEQDAEGFYVASVLELPGCHTQAKTLETLTRRLQEAVEVYLEVEKERSSSRFVGIIRIPF